MKVLCYVLMSVGMVLALGGVVAVFNFDQPSDMFSVVWWMIVGGWFLVLLGIGIDILHLVNSAKPDLVYGLREETNTTKVIKREVPRTS